MDISYLKEFIVLAEAGNFWEASERLYINQSTLSKHIKSLENELGASLFDRSTRRVKLTRYGSTLLPFAQSIVRSEIACRTKFEQIRNQEKGILSIGSIPDLVQYGISEVLRKFHSANPSVEYRITEADPKELTGFLKEGKCDLIFQRETKREFERNFMSDQEIERIPWCQDHLVAVIAKSHPLAREASLSLKALKDEKLLMIKEGSLMYDICTEVCHAAGFTPQIFSTSHSVACLLDEVSAGDGIALLMDRHIVQPSFAQGEARLPWVSVPLMPLTTTQISICYRKDGDLSSGERKFIHYLAAETDLPRTSLSGQS